MAKKFSKTEAQITKTFAIGEKFNYLDIEYKVILSGKPSPPGGECKTDTYILAKDKHNNEKEFKLSIKQDNADFLENKMKLERAIQIFGDDASQIIADSIKDIKSHFENDALINFEKNKKTEKHTIKIGWKFELTNKKSGHKSALMKLTQQQKVDVYSGTNLSSDKRNAKINGEEIINSGIANYILTINKDEILNINEVINRIKPISDYVKGKDIYFACKAINYRALKDKWDGNRPLAVFIDWKYEDSSITADIVFDAPLTKKANEIGEYIRTILNQLKIDNSNFDKMKKLLKNVKYFPED